MRTNFPGEANIIVATVKNNENMSANTKYGLYAAERNKFEICKYGAFEQNKLRERQLIIRSYTLCVLEMTRRL